ncbi:hypothetical protein DPMN_150088 [Dreissena polymorpha]|uniref:Uncharacterized protein n=1 Tax=Dreissena polymorpha TaxID=45954 RepID=A0A9D4J5B5_DREPO|nr:hypothetical protein DPMN_150088 [Dreissena polymorpha]
MAGSQWGSGYCVKPPPPGATHCKLWLGHSGSSGYSVKPPPPVLLIVSYGWVTVG